MDAPETSRDRFRIQSLGYDSPSDPFTLIDEQKESLGFYFIRLAALGVRPSLIVSDMTVAYTAVVAETSTLTSPLLIWYPTSVGYLAAYHSDTGHYKRLGERADVKICANKARYSGVPREDVMLEVYTEYTGKQLHFPGHPPMYDYEYAPQNEAIPFLTRVAQVAEDIDVKLIPRSAGVIFTTPCVVEPGGREYIESTWGKKAFGIGPQFPQHWWTTGSKGLSQTADIGGDSALLFLNSCRSKFGPQSVLYISFGTIFFPVGRVDLVQTLIDSLVAADPPLPFLMAATGIAPDIVADFRERIVRGGAQNHAMITGFAPQMWILTHPATGWFLTHGGNGSTCEALFAGMPMIFWPCAVDQPIIAAQLSHGLNMAYELLQIRNGSACMNKPTARGPVVLGTRSAILDEMSSIWSAMRGEDGAEKRRLTKEVSEKMRESWRNGDARRAMEEFAVFM